ncbi:hypothetical protein Gpo141_00014381, partial [Globisporangium polare]
MDTTTECASSSYEPPPWFVKPQIRRKSSSVASAHRKPV